MADKLYAAEQDIGDDFAITAPNPDTPLRVYNVQNEEP